LDFVSTENGKTNNQSRLFSQNYYSYGPPIDHDKFLNYENYYWYPPLDTNYSAITVEGVEQEIIATSGGQNTFTTTHPVDSTIDKVYFKGTITTDYTVVGKTLTLTSLTAQIGDVLKVTHYVDPDKIIGKKNFTTPNNIALSSGMLITIDPTYFTTSGTLTADTRYYVEGVGTTFGIELIAIDEEAELFLQETFLQWDRADTIGSTDVVTGWDAGRWDTISDITTPDYITIKRGSTDKNPWSRTNGWVHKDNVPIYRKVEAYTDTFKPWDGIEAWDVDNKVWDAVTVTSYVDEAFVLDNARKGNRPIVEFDKDIQLYNYGKTHLDTVDLLSTQDNKAQVEAGPSYTIDDIAVTDGMKILFVNPAFNTALTPWDSINDPWDHDSDNDASTGGGGLTGGDVGWDVAGSDFDVSSSLWQATVDGSSNISLTKVNVTVVDDSKITVRLGSVNGGKEYHWSGYNWVQSQTKSNRNVAPLYSLYDHKGLSLSDTINYPSSTFAGTPLFGYVTGTGSNDSVLGFPLSYDRYTGLGEIKFKNCHNDYNNDYGFTFYKKYNNPPILKQNFDKKVIVQPGVKSGNNFYIDGIRRENLILLRNHRYIFNLSDPSTSTTGYTGGYHPLGLSTLKTEHTVVVFCIQRM
jgi:hypothetical protein